MSPSSPDTAPRGERLRSTRKAAPVIGGGLLVAAVLFVWVRSYWVQSTVGLDGPSWGMGLSARVGEFILSADVAEFEWGRPYQVEYVATLHSPSARRYSDRKRPAPKNGHRFHFLDFTASRSFKDLPGLGRLTQYLLVLPGWLVCGVPLLLWVRSAIRLRRHRLRGWREARGLCLACGYDLRVTPGRCPECGTTTTTPTASPATP